MRKCPWLALLAGTATIVVVSGGMACTPTTTVDNGDTLGAIYLPEVEWQNQPINYTTWESYLGQDQ